MRGCVAGHVDGNAVAVVGAAKARHGRCCIGEGGPNADEIGQLHCGNFYKGEKETISGLESLVEGWDGNVRIYAREATGPGPTSWGSWFI